MKIKTETRMLNITLTVWDDSTSSYSPDCFNDLEASFIGDHEHEDDVFLATDTEVNDLIDWWRAECDVANTDPDYEGDGLCGAKIGTEYAFSVEEIEIAE